MRGHQPGGGRGPRSSRASRVKRRCRHRHGGAPVIRRLVRAGTAVLASALAAWPAPTARIPKGGPDWTRGGVCYEVFVRSFADSDGDGIGDINGLIGKLDYINDGRPASTTSLGADCIWLMPIAA